MPKNNMYQVFSLFSGLHNIYEEYFFSLTTPGFKSISKM